MTPSLSLLHRLMKLCTFSSHATRQTHSSLARSQLPFQKYFHLLRGVPAQCTSPSLIVMLVGVPWLSIPLKVSSIHSKSSALRTFLCFKAKQPTGTAMEHSILSGKGFRPDQRPDSTIVLCVLLQPVKCTDFSVAVHPALFAYLNNLKQNISLSVNSSC